RPSTPQASHRSKSVMEILDLWEPNTPQAKLGFAPAPIHKMKRNFKNGCYFLGHFTLELEYSLFVDKW
uniref:Uncharacterized protein n=1 Tax=Acrobeloides nanus TaxID=290746 RepID=A0A914DIA9_9BILA